MTVPQSSSPPTSTPTSTSFSENEARSAFEALEPELVALEPAEIQIARAHVQRAAAIAHSIAERDRVPLRASAFEGLIAAGLYRPELPTRLGQLALATWFARQQQMSHRDLATGSTVPETVEQAYQQRRRMITVLEYWFDHDPRLMEEVAAIRRGSGYVDLVNDLERLADIYERPAVRAEIEHDAQHVQPDDVSTARALARAIFSGLGVSAATEHERWTDLTQRAWTLLLREYEEHRAAAMFLLRGQEAVASTYPSLVTASRTSRPRRVTEGDVEDSLEVEPSVDDEADEAVEAVEAAEAAVA